MEKIDVIRIMSMHDFVLREEKIIPHGEQLIFRNGAIVCVYRTGKINVQGKHFDIVTKLLANAVPSRQIGNTADDEF